MPRILNFWHLDTLEQVIVPKLSSRHLRWSWANLEQNLGSSHQISNCCWKLYLQRCRRERATQQKLFWTAFIWHNTRQKSWSLAFEHQKESKRCARLRASRCLNTYRNSSKRKKSRSKSSVALKLKFKNLFWRDKRTETKRKEERN